MSVELQLFTFMACGAYWQVTTERRGRDVLIRVQRRWNLTRDWETVESGVVTV